QKIGQGRQADVFQVRVNYQNPTNGQIEYRDCALKLLRISQALPDFTVHRLLTEDHESAIQHHILKLLGVITFQQRAAALMPLCS
ncbi:hypothetical protein RYX56_24010, partial [Alkalihalophilus lindianensis]